MRMLIPVQNSLPSRLASPLPLQYQSRFESSLVERDGISSNFLFFFQEIPPGHYGLESARSIGEWHERMYTFLTVSEAASQADTRIPSAKQRTGEEFAPPGPTTTNTPSPQNSTQSTSRTGARANVPENNSEVKYSIYPEPRFARITWKETLKNCLHVLTFFFPSTAKNNGHAANGSTAFHQVDVVEETGNLTYPGMYVTTRKTVCVILYSTLLYEPEPRETG